MPRTLDLDIECYKDYFLVKLKAADTGKSRDYEQYDGHPLDVRELKVVLANYTICTFNGNNYDIPILTLALRGASCAQLKAASDWIIVGGHAGWEFYEHFDLPRPDWLDHIDLIEVVPGQASLKLYGGRLHSRKLQDLPIEPGASISPEQRAVLREYCENDLDTTRDLRMKLQAQLDLRTKMSAEYGIDLRSKSDAQIAEAVIRSKVSALLGRKVSKPEVPAGTRFKYQPPNFLQFFSRELQEKLDQISQAEFVISENGAPIEPPALQGSRIAIGNSVYRMGIGGLHSSEYRTAHIADEDTLIIDRDVASYYPAIVLNCRLFPEHLTDAFLQVYRDIVNRRLEAKRAGDKVVADALKITINGSFGKLGSKYSVLYSPNLLIQVTLTGQLALLMLIEALERAGVPVVSANTDGIVLKCPKARYADALGVISWWENATGFETEETRYRALYSRDVNNYVAVKDQGGTKGKGAFADPAINKNPENSICVDAVCAFLEHGTPVAQTILACRDIRKFVTVRTVRGGAIYPTAKAMVDDWVQVDGRTWMREAWLDDPSLLDLAVTRVSRPYPVEVITESLYLGKVVRYYYGTTSSGDIRYRAGNTKGNHNKVPRSDGAVPLMTLPDEFPADVDHSRYIEDAREILFDIGAMK
jgi:hypothetical protein